MGCRIFYEKSFLVFAPVALLSAVFFLLHKKTATSTMSGGAPSFVPQAPMQKGLGQYLRSPRAGYKEILQKDESTPKACLDFFDSLQRLDFFAGEVSQMSYQTLPMPPDACKDGLEKNLAKARQDFLKKCRPQNQNLSDKIGEDCISAVYFLRARITELSLKNKPVSEIVDLKQLTDLIFAQLSDEHPNFDQMKLIADRMLELDPNIMAAHKVNVIASIFEGFAANEAHQNREQAWANANAALQGARNLNSNDPIIKDASIAIQTKGFDPELTRDYAENMIHENKNQDQGYFLLAYAQWKQGEQAIAKNNLNRAIALAPDNDDYKKVQTDISKPGATRDSFKGIFKVGISYGDFTH